MGNFCPKEIKYMGNFCPKVNRGVVLFEGFSHCEDLPSQNSFIRIVRRFQDFIPELLKRREK